MSLDVGSMIRVRLPGLPWIWARVQWIREEYFGLFMTKALPLKALQQQDGSEKIPSAQPRYDVNIRARIASPLISRIVTILNISTNGLQFETGLPIARSEEHTSELQSLMRISYAVFCLKKKKKYTHKQTITT